MSDEQLKDRIEEMERSLRSWRRRLAEAVEQVHRHEGGLEELRKLKDGNNQPEGTPGVD